MILVSGIVFFFGVLSLVINRKHMLVMLLSLEFMMMGVLLSVVSCLGCLNMSATVVYLVVVVCEASLGLSLLVALVYFFGSDYFSSFSVVAC